MKHIIFVAGLALALSYPSVHATSHDKKPEVKRVCVDVQGKDGKPVMDPKTKKPKQNCKDVKVREKHEGTKVPDKK
jgi:hypothetical protein